MTDEKPTQAAQGETSPQQDVKPEVKPELPHLTLTVVHQDMSRVPFKVKKTTVFDKLFKAYCQKKALDQANLVFMDVEGKRILAHQTPAEFKMQDGDVIEAANHQVGG